NAQARAIMRRANLVGAQCGISYITSSDAKLVERGGFTKRGPFRTKAKGQRT
uniref:Transposase n=1 Tax=Globodera pallida TaxID=36090 RepID=A0A183CT28_GLOPA